MTISEEYTLKDLKDFCKKAEIKCSGKKEEVIYNIQEYLKEYKYAPRYLRGLSRDEKLLKKFEIRRNTLNEKSGEKKVYKPSSLDIKYRSPKLSKYTEKWNIEFPDTKSIPEKSKITGVPKDILQRVYNKGMDAWRGSSHRPGASQQAWGVSRVNSFLTCGKTFYFPDHLLAFEAMERSKKAQRWFEERGCKFSKMGKRTASR
jgi:hypothetical protein